MNLTASLRQNTLGISIFAVVTAGLIAVTQVATHEAIRDNQRAQKARALYEIVPQAGLDDELLDHVVAIQAPTLGYPHGQAYQAIQNGNVTTVILPVIAPDGYSGDIHLVVGIHADSSIAGVRVLAHKETPGLGDKIDLNKSDWVLGFNNKTMVAHDDPNWAVAKDGGQFDQFTGATITPRAVVKATAAAIRYFNSQRALLLTPTPKSASS